MEKKELLSILMKRYMEKKIILSGVGGLAFLVFVLYSIGFFSPKIAPTERKKSLGISFKAKKELAIQVQKIQPYHRAIGTVTSQRVIVISSQVNGAIAKVYVREGSPVKKNDPLADINDSEFKSKLELARRGAEIAESSLQQAIQTLVIAQANLARIRFEYQSLEAQSLQAIQKNTSAKKAYETAHADLMRIDAYRQTGAATQKEFEAAQNTYVQTKADLEQARLGVKISETQISGMKEILKSTEAGTTQAQLGIDSAKARLEQAKQLIKESEIALGYTQIKAPEDGVVATKNAEPGDLAWPGKPLFTIHKPELLQLECEIPESMRSRISSDEKYSVEIESIRYQEKGSVAQLVPSADPQSRTFQIKIQIPYEKGLYPGMFGTLLIPLEEESLLLVPSQAIERVGQFESIYVKDSSGLWERRFVTSGKTHGTLIEVLSGLNPGETLALGKE